MKKIRGVIKLRFHDLKLRAHRIGSRWYHYAEHGCAVGYGIHEVFHITFPVLVMSYGLLAFGIMLVIGMIGEGEL